MRRTIARCFVVVNSALSVSSVFPVSSVSSVASMAVAQSRAKTLDIYVIDVEGGNATLFVAPSGESVLIDTGNPPSAANRDAERIMAAVNDAGVKQIDPPITAHWHGDHFGAMSELASRIPITHYVDHGPTIQPQTLSTRFLTDTYPTLHGKATHTVTQAGDRLSIAVSTGES